MKKHLSLKTQLLAIILTVTLISTFMAFSFSIIYDHTNSFRTLDNSMRFMARLIAENSKSPILFGDTLGARELLSSFTSIPLVQFASINDTHDSIFALYSVDDVTYEIPAADSLSEYNYFSRRGLNISFPIMQQDMPFGRLALHVSTDHIFRKFQLNILLFLSVFTILMLVAYVVALKLQKIISDPILELKNKAELITHNNDYSIRIPRTRDNEIGLLQTSMDTMVHELDKHIVSLKNEINDKIRSQQETQHLRQYLSNIINSISSVIVAVDQDGIIKQINRETARYFSQDEKAFINRPAVEVIPPIMENETYLISSINNNRPENFFCTCTHPVSKQQIDLDISLYPLSNVEKEGVVVVIDDATEKNRFERVMIQNEKMASLGGLAAGMAHEINNPLGIISQGVQNILRHISPEGKRNIAIAGEFGIDIEGLNRYLEKRKVLRYLDGILSASKRASEIVSNMLQFSRMSNQSKAPADLAELVTHTIELAGNEYELKKKYDFRQISIRKEFDVPLPEVICNHTEIQQVLLNLLKNAAHALFDMKREHFKPEITISLINMRTQVRIEVEDNGPGMTEDVAKKIFEPFFTTKEVGKGTGLGLSVSYFIITKNHSGTFEVESVVGKGTKFIIGLPVKVKENTKQEKPVSNS